MRRVINNFSSSLLGTDEMNLMLSGKKLVSHVGFQGVFHPHWTTTSPCPTCPDSLQLGTPGLSEDTLAWPALEHMKVTDISCQLLISWPSP